MPKKKKWIITSAFKRTNKSEHLNGVSVLDCVMQCFSYFLAPIGIWLFVCISATKQTQNTCSSRKIYSNSAIKRYERECIMKFRSSNNRSYIQTTWKLRYHSYCSPSWRWSVWAKHIIQVAGEVVFLNIFLKISLQGQFLQNWYVSSWGKEDQSVRKADTDRKDHPERKSSSISIL